ncbi:hypothetical protein HC891_16645 [Candidatus Gracilibacteria bacterium]|nr:hypothetical protein [Candidatus Gracilibacteria bacterium]
MTAAGRDAFYAWLRPQDQERITARWGNFPGDIAPLGRDAVRLGGMQLGNIYIGVQPMIGMPGDPMRLLFDRENTPHHQFALFYKYIAEDFAADAIVHLGMHGTAEWMPGVQLGPTADCWPDVLLGSVPNFYVYPINNPAEANIAKRRGYSTIIGHAIPPYGRAGLYRELQALRDLIQDSGFRIQDSEGSEQSTEHRAQSTEHRTQNLEPRTQTRHDPVAAQHAAPIDPTGHHAAQSQNQGTIELGNHEHSAQCISSDEEAILQKIALLNLDSDLVRGSDEAFSAFAARVYRYLRELEQTLIIDSLHELGTAPPPEQQLSLIVEALKIGRDGNAGLADVIADGKLQLADYAALLTHARAGDGVAQAQREQIETVCNTFVERAIIRQEALELVAAELQLAGVIARLQPLMQHGTQMLVALRDNTQEIGYLLKGLAGGYIPGAPGGDLIRDGLAVLPTGRNIHSLDPFRIPGESAYKRGIRIAEALISAHRSENAGAYPETIAQVLWGLDTIKTKGESSRSCWGGSGHGRGKTARAKGCVMPSSRLRNWGDRASMCGGRPRVCSATPLPARWTCSIDWCAKRHRPMNRRNGTISGRMSTRCWQRGRASRRQPRASSPRRKAPTAQMWTKRSRAAPGRNAPN